MAKRKVPENYKEGLPRVSSIVEYAFPFYGEQKDRFLEWLERKDISYSAYMEEASSGGRYVHSKLEEFINKGETKPRKYRGFVSSGIRFLNEMGVVPIHTEKYVSCRNYQGTIDLVATIGRDKWILDWKTYGLAKEKFGVMPTSYRKPYDKLKKARLQLSLYARIEKADRIGVVELGTDGNYRLHELDLVPEKEMRELIKEYKLSMQDDE